MTFEAPTMKQRAQLLREYKQTERLIDEHERRIITNISTTTWWRMSKKHLVPECKLKGGRKYWLLSDLLHWIIR